MAVVQLLTLAPRRVHVRCFATPRPRPAQLFGAAAQAQQPAACALAACRRLHSGSSCQHPAVLDTIEVIAAQQFPRVRCEFRVAPKSVQAYSCVLGTEFRREVVWKRPPGSSYTQR